MTHLHLCISPNRNPSELSNTRLLLPSNLTLIFHPSTVAPVTASSILEVLSLGKTYPNGESTLTVLKDISFSLKPGSTCAILGPSGSGKTTLLGLCAGLDQPTEGKVWLDGVQL